MNDRCCKCFESLVSKEIIYGLHRDCFKSWFDLTHNSEFLDIAARSQSQRPLEVQEFNISFFNGAYKKYSASLENMSYILKVQQKEYPELPATEFLCNQIYESLSIEIPRYYLIRFPENELCFVTKNFMSGLVSSSLDHIWHYVKDDKRHDCESLVTIIGEQTGRRVEQERFVFLTLADSLIGNNDRHGRNLGFIRNPKGSFLSPFYDNPSALGIEDHSILGADLQPRGSIHTRNSDKPTMKEYIFEWDHLGYGDVVSSFRKKISTDKLRILVENSYLSEKRKKAFLSLIFKRYEELCAN